MKAFLQVALIVISVLITVSVLMQNQGSGLGTAFGGETNFYRTKRGAEKFMFYGTIALGVGFVVCIVGLLIIK
ncbi:preprotein translocase subunit SecG [Patescibacteria group bacterium]|nr:preprotein translocase subunit SecG [Patescibacteria group bacterium]